MSTLHKAVLPGLYVLGPERPKSVGAAEMVSPMLDSPPSVEPVLPTTVAVAASFACSKRNKINTQLPPGAVFDDEVMTFKGYYMESVANSALEVRVSDLFGLLGLT